MTGSSEFSWSEHALTDVSQAMPGARVIAADTSQDSNWAELRTVARRTPSGRIVLDNGAAYQQQDGMTFEGIEPARGTLFAATPQTLAEAERRIADMRANGPKERFRDAARALREIADRAHDLERNALSLAERFSRAEAADARALELLRDAHQRIGSLLGSVPQPAAAETQTDREEG
ncbi:hypothetical protein [Azospirillum sp. SYSU D00513]|uniref:hypothetical protein n=1 Tax=Azospirillum sp. SYSU D00513 TaxID=2812561 RepID=UPI001A96A96F|nr:hypothetical protein [Azospirillum sp. SYSU D00513]